MDHKSWIEINPQHQYYNMENLQNSEGEERVCQASEQARERARELAREGGKTNGFLGSSDSLAHSLHYLAPSSLDMQLRFVERQSVHPTNGARPGAEGGRARAGGTSFLPSFPRSLGPLGNQFHGDPPFAMLTWTRGVRPDRQTDRQTEVAPINACCQEALRETSVPVP